MRSLTFVYGVMLLLCACSSSRVPPAGEKDGPPRFPPPLKTIKTVIPTVQWPSPYGNPATYVALGKQYHVLDTNQGYRATGIASWYGRKFHGRRTSSGEPFDMYAMTAAHQSLPIPSYVRVRNLENGKEIIVKINDRGPFIGDRILDLSYNAARSLDLLTSGTAKVQIIALDPIQHRTREQAIAYQKKMLQGGSIVKENHQIQKNKPFT